MPAGEIDRGTADFFLCLPVTRKAIFLSETIGWLVSGGVMLTAGLLGHLIASAIVHAEMRLSLVSAVLVISNLAAVYLAIGSFVFLVSALSDRRGRAIGIVFSVLLVSLLLNFLAQFQDWAKAISWLSVMEYYRPAIVIQEGRFPVRDVVTLLTLSACFWIAALVTFQRRSICTV
jgi:ABC-type transport system involved in multi-copper enzyme maturation permease subunit